jgi:hypothetical protein
VRSAFAPCALASKFGVYLEKERLSPFHSTEVNFLVEMAPSSFSKNIKKYPLVRSDTKMKVAWRWSFRLSCRALNVALPPIVHPMTVLRAFLVVLPCISITISFGNSASSSRL